MNGISVSHEIPKKKCSGFQPRHDNPSRFPSYELRNKVTLIKFGVHTRLLLTVLGLAIVSSLLHAEYPNAISSIGGKYFTRRVELSVPDFAQDDPRWSDLHLGKSDDTLGDEGCAVTSAAMVAAFYGVETDPSRLNDFLTRTGGLDREGYIDWEAVSSVAPGRFKLVYDGTASYKRIDETLIMGAPVIVLIPLSDGAYHFVVIVGKAGKDYLILDPAAGKKPYPLRQLTNRIGGICIFRACGRT